MRQKMEFVADLTADVEPTDAELKAFVAEHPEWFRTEPRFCFDQVYFPAGGGSEGGRAERSAAGSECGNRGGVDRRRPVHGGRRFRDLSRSAVAQTFGEDFAVWIDKIAAAHVERSGHLGYGTHLVRVTERVEAREPPFEEVRDAARREWLHARKVAANEALYQKLRSRYVIKVEPPLPGRSRKGGPRSRRDPLLIVLWVALTLVAGHAQAHDLRPAYLAITESAPDIYAVLWKAPAMGERGWRSIPDCRRAQPRRRRAKAPF